MKLLTIHKLSLQHKAEQYDYKLVIKEGMSEATLTYDEKKGRLLFDAARLVVEVEPRSPASATHSLVSGFVQLMNRCEIICVYPASGDDLDERRALLATIKHPCIPCVDGYKDGEHCYYLPIQKGGGLVIGDTKHINEETRKAFLNALLPPGMQTSVPANMVALLDRPFVTLTNAGIIDKAYDLNRFAGPGEWKKGMNLVGPVVLDANGIVNAEGVRVWGCRLRYMEWKYTFTTGFCMQIVEHNQVPAAVVSKPGKQMFKLDWQFNGFARFSATGICESFKLRRPSIIGGSFVESSVEIPEGGACNAYIDKNAISIEDVSVMGYESTASSRLAG